MARRGGRLGTVLTFLTVWSALAGTGPAGAAPAGRAPAVRSIAPGVEYSRVDFPSARGVARAHVLRVDLREPGVRVGLLHPGVVSARATVSRLADSMGAVAGINGDFFHMSETQHPGVEATGAAVGPQIADGRHLKAAVPKGQRFGPSLPPGTGTQDVLGVGTDRTARLDGLALDGSFDTPDGTVRLGGLNQYALPVGSVGAFTPDWGSASRMRAVCGTDTSRSAPCSTDTYEVTVAGGRVVETADVPGRGAIPAGSTVLVGREAGAQRLRKLGTGDAVTVRHRLVAARSGVAYWFAIGGYPIRRGGLPLAGLDDSAAAVRTAAGFADGGREVLLVALDGAPDFRAGLTVSELATVMGQLGATDALNLDGGGSSTLVARPAGGTAVTVRNNPSAGAQRLVPNGIGVFASEAVTAW